MSFQGAVSSLLVDLAAVVTCDRMAWIDELSGSSDMLSWVVGGCYRAPAHM